MSQSSLDAKQAIQPVPIIPIEAEPPAARNAVEEDDRDSTPHGSEHHGFACGAADVVSTPGIPWERRPLSRRGILSWTIAAMSGLVALVTTVAVAHSPHASNPATATALHGSEATNAPPVANLPPIAATETHSPPIIPLESLPIDKAPTPHATKTSNHPHARVAPGASGSIAIKKAAPTQRMLRQRKISTR